MKKMLVTGANGFIGSSARDFFRQEYDVYGIDVIGVEDNKNFVVDMRTEKLKQVLESVAPDIIIHAAGGANVSYSIAHPKEDFDNSVCAFYNMLEVLRGLNLQSKIIFLSSAAVYGNAAEECIKENSEKSPISPYGLHKKICEDIAGYYIRQYQMDITILRIFSVYGPGLKKQIMWDMFQKYKKYGKIELYGTGDEARDFIFIDDVIRSIDCILKENVKDGIYNIANGKAHTIREVAEIFAAELLEGSEIYFNHMERKGDPEWWCADITNIKELGYEQKVQLEEGIKRYISWAENTAEV